MNLNEAKKRIQSYLQADRSWPLIVDIQSRNEIAEIVDYFKIGGNQFLDLRVLCNDDEVLKLDELYAAISSNNQDLFITEITAFLKLQGEDALKNALRTLTTESISGHVIIVTYQCKNYLKFSDPRIYESGRIIIVDGTPDQIPSLYFVNNSLADIFPGTHSGIQEIGYVMEHCELDNAYIATSVTKESFTESIYHISQLDNGYDILKDKDSRTGLVPKSCGSADQWNYAIQKMGKNGNWATLIEEQFGSEHNLDNAITGYVTFTEEKKWLYFIALSICGANNNEYLQMAVNSSTSYKELIRHIYRTILTIEYTDERFDDYYVQRKSIIGDIGDDLAEIVDYCKVVSIKGEHAIYYLTDLTVPEKERVIYWLTSFGKKYNTVELGNILSIVYPDLSNYLSKYRFNNKLLDSYFEDYKYQKITNQILPSFETMVDEQSTKLDFVQELKPRASIVEKLNTTNAKAFFFDALGVEYLGFIQEKCSEYDLSTIISCARSELPSLTSFNKEFVETLKIKGCDVHDIKKLDEVKHHGENNFDYEKEKNPVYLIKELEIIDKLLKKIRAEILSGQYEKAIIISDHGASRLAVLHETENIWSMGTSGVHSGRCCPISDIDSKPDYAIEENGFWVLANYDRFKGGRKANVEVHGGASLEEVAIPIIEITQKRAGVEAFITDNSKTIELGAMEHASIDIYVGIKSSNIVIKMDGNYYDAKSTDNPYIYHVDLPDCSKKGVYEFTIYNGSDLLASGQKFEIKKKGMSEVDLFG